MKKMKLTFMTLVIFSSIGAAFATRPHTMQTNLYMWNGSTYQPAGTMGQNYTCLTAQTTCVYSLSNGVYSPYIQNAQYTPIPNITKPEPKDSKKGH